MAHQFSLGRGAGLLLPLSSVRGRGGDLGSYADAGDVARLLRTAGCSLWQVLPLNEVSPGQDSPYAASSSCALEPVHVDLDALEDLDGLTDGERRELDRLRADSRVDFEAYRRVKRSAVSRAFGRFRGEKGSARQKSFARFREDQRGWLDDWTLYRALHEERRKSWRDWEPELRDRDPAALDAAKARLGDKLDELAYLQWVADEQWRRGRQEANALGVRIAGDLPFMVAEDSADVWEFQRFFRFDATVGVPPDAYSADGQDWGLPVPRWEEMRAEGDPWLHQRATRAAELYDAFRVDHVVGLYRTYVRPLDKSRAPYFIPGEVPLQKEQGERILALLGERAEVLAEDLGTVPDFVRKSLVAMEIPGTKVLRWENDRGVPRDLTRVSRVNVVVTGTHDTESLRTWWESLEDWERDLQLAQPLLQRLRGPDQRKFTPETKTALLELAYASACDALLTPVTDALGWSDRMNTPGTVGPHNWTFRLPWRLAEMERQPETVAVARELAHLAEKYGRKR